MLDYVRKFLISSLSVSFHISSWTDPGAQTHFEFHWSRLRHGLKTPIWKLALEVVVEAEDRGVIARGLFRVGGWTTTVQPCENANV